MTKPTVSGEIEKILIEASVFKGSPKNEVKQFLVPEFYLDQALSKLQELIKKAKIEELERFRYDNFNGFIDDISYGWITIAIEKRIKTLQKGQK